LAFDSAVPAQVVVGAVTIILTIGLVMLVIVTNKVAKSKTVMTCDEVNAVSRQSSIIRVEIAAASNATGYFTCDAAVAAQKSANHVAVATVPFAPRESGKRANVVKPCSVPCFSNERQPRKRQRKFNVPRQRWIR